MSETIFISLASYREPELRSTIESALENAVNPGRIHFGVYSQVEDGEHPDLSDIPNLVEEVVPSSVAKGPGYARAQVMKMFQDQNYFLQIDAHSIFAKNWDKKVIDLYKKIQQETQNDKIIISFWGKPYSRHKETGEIIYEYQDGKWDVDLPHYTELARYNKSWIGGRVAMDPKYTYHESAVALGGFIFAEKRIVSEVPYDEEISWTGEEFMFSIRAYTRGWKIYSPYQLFLYHNYERHNNPRVWNDNPEWAQLEINGRRKMYRALVLKDTSIWGIQNARLYSQYQKKHKMNILAEARKHLREMM